MAIAAIDFQLLANEGFPPAPFKPGETIFAAGEKGDNMYVIRSAEVEIERDGKVVEQLGPGGIFGEMALIDRAPMSTQDKIGSLGNYMAQEKLRPIPIDTTERSLPQQALELLWPAFESTDGLLVGPDAGGAAELLARL